MVDDNGGARGDALPRVQDKAKTFDFSKFWRNLEEAQRLQVSRDEITWHQSYTRPTESVDVLLNFGCGVQTVPYLMMLQMAVFEALGVDFVAMAGPQYCCGNPFVSKGREEQGNRLANKAMRHFASWQAHTNVQCCRSCFNRFSQRVAKAEEAEGSAPFEVVQVTRFLLHRLRELGEQVPWVAPVRRRVLLHADGAELDPTEAEQRADVIATLQLIPGVEYVGLVDDPSLGAPCRSRGGVPMVNDISAEQYRQVQAELSAQLQAAGADAIVTHHHGCYREWSKFAAEDLPVMHYEALLLEALGRRIPDRFQELWQLGNVDKILERSRPLWQSWGISDADARDLVRKVFVPAYAAQLQSCPCEGSCFAQAESPDPRADGCPISPGDRRSHAASGTHAGQ